MKKTLYLASPYGFSAQWKERLLPQFVATLEALGAEVWEPFARNNQVDFSAPGWAYQVGQADLRDVVEADAIFAIVNGTPPDEGVMVELGAAIALGQADLPLPRRLPPLHGFRELPPEPDAVHRPARRRLGSLLLHIARGNQRTRQGSGALAARRTGLRSCARPFPPICCKTQKLKRPKRSCAPAFTAAFAMPPAPPTCSPATNSKAHAAASTSSKASLKRTSPQANRRSSTSTTASAASPARPPAPAAWIIRSYWKQPDHG